MELLQFEVTNAGTLGEGGPTSVTLPDSITHIGSYAFYHCTNLTSDRKSTRLNSSHNNQSRMPSSA